MKNGKNEKMVEPLEEEKVLNATELFAIQGGEDNDLDEDCYVLDCLVAASGCVNAKCIAFS